jgi:RNA polymerase sigma factor (sigma-70 family)
LGIADHERQFRQWLGEHKGLLVKVVRAFAEGPADQDDLFQEVLLQVWLSLPNFRDDSKPTTWLYRVALNTALAWKRSEKKRRGRQGPLPISDSAAQMTTSADMERDSQVVDQRMPRSALCRSPSEPWWSFIWTVLPIGKFRKWWAFQSRTSASA